MTEQPNFPPMHPVTRLGRVIQQLRSFSDLHAGELEGLAVELDAAGAGELAVRLRAYRDVQRDEATMVVDELVDIQRDMAAATQPVEPPEILPATVTGDPAVNSPKRAKWLAEQEAEAERLRQPRSRRDLFGRVSKADDEES
jgi:hypothetical protein